jgi:hypothetical protein
MTKRTRAFTATALAALGLSGVSPVQQGAALVAAGTMVLWASPALAQNNIPGVGTVVKKKPGDASIIAPGDANGEVRLTGLAPGEYSVKLFGGREETSFRVGQDGRLAFVAYEDIKRPAGPAMQNGRRMPVDPVVRRWAQAIPFDGGKSGAFNPNDAGVIDVNTASAQMLTRGTLNTPETAAFIIAERSKGGAFKNAQDFARRVGAKVPVNFDDASIRMGDTTILMRRGVDPKSPGWISFPGDGGGFTLFGDQRFKAAAELGKSLY